MGNPVDVHCSLHAVDAAGHTQATASFSLQNPDGEVDHSGDLNVIRESRVDEDLDTQCDDQ
jgi:hypothetical protein